MEAEIVAKISQLHFSASLFLTLIKKLGAKTIAGKQFLPQILTLDVIASFGFSPVSFSRGRIQEVSIKQIAQASPACLSVCLPAYTTFCYAGTLARDAP